MVKSETRLAFVPSAWDEIHGIDKNGDAFHAPTYREGQDLSSQNRCLKIQSLCG